MLGDQGLDELGGPRLTQNQQPAAGTHVPVDGQQLMILELHPGPADDRHIVVAQQAVGKRGFPVALQVELVG